MPEVIIDMDVEQTIKIVREELIEAYHEIPFNLGSKEEEDGVREALSEVILYYSTPEEAQQWRDIIKHDD